MFVRIPFLPEMPKYQPWHFFSLQIVWKRVVQPWTVQAEQEAVIYLWAEAVAEEEGEEALLAMVVAVVEEEGTVVSALEGAEEGSVDA